MELIYTDTDFDLPIPRTNFKIADLDKYGIFLPSVVIVGAYNRYTFSCLDWGLYLINGRDSSACIILKITSNGIFSLTVGCIANFIYLTPSD